MESISLMLILISVMVAFLGLAITLLIKRQRNPFARQIKPACPTTNKPYDKSENVQQPAGIESSTTGTSAIKARLQLPDKSDILLSDATKTLGRNDFENHVSSQYLGYLSRHHCQITNDNGIYYIRDENSANGTTVNGMNIKDKGRLELREGDKIDIAGVILTFSYINGYFQNETFRVVHNEIPVDRKEYKTNGNDEDKIEIMVKSYLKKKTEKKVVRPLLHVKKMNFILCHEGIYVMNVFGWTRRRYYELYSWQSLIITTIDEKHGIIVLKLGKDFYHLQAKAGSPGKHADFDNMKDIVLAYIPESRRTTGVKRSGYRWWVLAISIAVLIAAQITASSIIEKISAGKVGDGLDDITGARIDYRDGIQIYNNKKLIHEYGYLGGQAYLIIHPIVATNTLLSVLHKYQGITGTWNNVVINGNVNTSGAFNIITDCGLTAMCWLCIIGLIVRIAASGQWKRQLRQ